MTSRQVWLVRHGETEWSRDLRHTGRTDIPLTAKGEEQARALRDRLDRPWALVLSSPLQRAWRTAELARLQEWDYGPAEGRTTKELSRERPWRVWDEADLGETVHEVADRCRRVLARLPAEGDSVLVAHGHLLRVLTAVYLDLDPREGRHLVLEAGKVSVLGSEHEWPAVVRWNA